MLVLCFVFLCPGSPVWGLGKLPMAFPAVMQQSNSLCCVLSNATVPRPWIQSQCCTCGVFVKPCLPRSHALHHTRLQRCCRSDQTASTFVRPARTVADHRLFVVCQLPTTTSTNRSKAPVLSPRWTAVATVKGQRSSLPRVKSAVAMLLLPSCSYVGTTETGTTHDGRCCAVGCSHVSTQHGHSTAACWWQMHFVMPACLTRLFFCVLAGTEWDATPTAWQALG